MPAPAPTAQDIKDIREVFDALFDEFKCVNSTKITLMIKLAATRVAKGAWGGNYAMGAAYLAAHMLATNGPGGGGGGVGPVTSESVGEMSRSYATIGLGTADELYTATRYGQLFIALRRETVFGMNVTGGFPMAGRLVPDGGF